MKKILIYYDENNLKPVGGPSGYLYNLKQGLEHCHSEIEIDFLHSSYKKNELLFRTYKSLPASLLRYIQKYRTYKKYLRIAEGNSQEHIPDMDEYDAIHFHSTQSLYKCMNQLKDYHGKVILTSHTPKAPHCEILEDELEGRHCELHRALERVDVCAFNRADYIVFPCIDAEEPYYHTWRRYEEVRKNNKEKYRYLLTGCRKKSTSLSRKEARKRYGIDDDMFVVSFIGRHNKVKGYDRLKNIASEIIAKEKKIIFLTCELKVCSTKKP